MYLFQEQSCSMPGNELKTWQRLRIKKYQGYVKQNPERYINAWENRGAVKVMSFNASSGSETA